MALMACILIGAAYALFTVQDTKTNVFTLGSVDVELHEDILSKTEGVTVSSDGKTINVANNILPGDKFIKDPTLWNTGNNDAFAYIAVSIPTTYTEDGDVELFEYEFNTENWSRLACDCGWYVEEPASSDGTSEILGSHTYYFCYKGTDDKPDVLPAQDGSNPYKSEPIFMDSEVRFIDNGNINYDGFSEALNIVVTGYACQTRLDSVEQTSVEAWNTLQNNCSDIPGGDWTLLDYYVKFTGRFEYLKLTPDGTIYDMGSYVKSPSVVLSWEQLVEGYKSDELGYDASTASTVGDYAFCGACVEEIVMPPTITSIGKYAFYGNFLLKEIELPEGVLSIGDNCFDRSGLTEIVLPDGIEVIPDRAFCGCPLINITFPSGLKTIGKAAFGSTCLNTVILPDGIESIAYGAFIGAENHRSIKIYIPKTIKSIDKNAFDSGVFWIKMYANIYFEGTQEEWKLVTSMKTTETATINVHYNSVPSDCVSE